MKRQVTRMSASALAAGLMLFTTAFGQEKAAPEHYYAIWAVTGGGAGGTTVPVDVRINRYNTEQEISDYAALLKKSGPDGLRRALEKEDVGQFSPSGKVGTPIAIARKLSVEGKTVIRVLTLRTQSFTELWNGGRVTDYPYAMLELVLETDGKGAGSAMAAAKVSFNKKKDIYEIESFGHGQMYHKLLNIQTMK
jgi:hypothetical protein